MPKVLSDRDAAELEAMLRWWRSNTDTRYQRRRKHGGGGTRLHKAYAKTAAGAGSTIVCYRGSDSHDPDDEITVTIEIADGGANLNEALPRLADGTMITVWADGDTWRSVMTFQASGDC